MSIAENADTTPVPQYPEHEKLAKVQPQTQAAGEFLEWLGTQGYHLAIVVGDDAEVPLRMGQMVPWGGRISELLARWQEIDENRLEAEKRQMLESLRNRGAR